VRALFCILVLLNLGFFGWTHWIDTPTAAYVAPSRPDGSLPTLALVGKRAAGAAPGAPGTSASAAPAAPGERCRSLGPFEDAATAARVAGRLRERGLSASERDVDISVNDGYTVYIDQLADAAAMSRALARLQRAGIPDVHAGSGPGGRPWISFGVFQDQPHAVRRAEQVRGLGFKPVLDIHQSTSTTRWLDLTLRANEPEPAVEQLLGAGAAGAAAGAAGGAGATAVAFSDCPAKGS